MNQNMNIFLMLKEELPVNSFLLLFIKKKKHNKVSDKYQQFNTPS